MRGDMRFFTMARTALFILICSGSAWGQAKQVYVTPSGTETGNCPAGTTSSPNYAISMFSTSSNWGTGTGQVGPGTRILLCGAFKAPAGGDLIFFQGSGTSGSPIT